MDLLDNRASVVAEVSARQKMVQVYRTETMGTGPP